MENLIKRSLNAIRDADLKAIKMIEADIEPSVESDKLQECLLGMLQQDMEDETVDSFIHDLYIDKLSTDQLYDKYFTTMEISL